MRKADREHLSSPGGSETGAVGTPPRKDGRRPLMVYLDPTLIKDLKKEALDRDINVYELVEEILKQRRA